MDKAAQADLLLSSLQMIKEAGVELNLHGYHREPKSKEMHEASHRNDEAFDDLYDHHQESRIKTKHKSNGKFIADFLEDAMSARPKAEHHDFTSDFCYGDKPQEKRLNRAELRKTLDTAKSHEAVYLAKQPAWRAAEEKAQVHSFLQHGESLLKHPDFKFARYEWE